MSNALEQKLQEIVSEGFQPELRGTSGTCCLEVDGGESQWIRIQDGAVSILNAPVDPDCTLASSSDDWERIAAGTQNPLTTWLRGDLRVSGDAQFANRVGRLFI
jgi:putative sterol carrier protein